MPTELRRSLRAHERVPMFIDNLAKELRKMPMTLKRETIHDAVRDLTLLFINTAQTARDQKMLSVMSKLSLEAQIQKRKDLAAEVDAINQRSTDHVSTEKGFEVHQSQSEFKA